MIILITNTHDLHQKLNEEAEKKSRFIKKFLKHPFIALWVEKKSSRRLKKIVYGVLGTISKPYMFIWVYDYLATI